jgi:hypothetical protein
MLQLLHKMEILSKFVYESCATASASASTSISSSKECLQIACRQVSGSICGGSGAGFLQHSLYPLRARGSFGPPLTPVSFLMSWLALSWRRSLYFSLEAGVCTHIPYPYGKHVDKLSRPGLTPPARGASSAMVSLPTTVAYRPRRQLQRGSSSRYGFTRSCLIEFYLASWLRGQNSPCQCLDSIIQTLLAEGSDSTPEV